MSPSTSSSQFPRFPDGDVTIVVSTNKIYHLHAHTLRQKSPYFAQYLYPESAPKLNLMARKANLTPWRFQLYEDLQEGGGLCAFVPIKIGENGRPQGTFLAPRASTTSITGEDTDEDRAWDWLFGCFYDIKPAFDEANFGGTVEDCIKLVQAADVIGAIDSVRESVDLALLRQDTILWRSIAVNPVVWAELGRRVQSPIIFKEAVVHVIGRWKMLSADDRESLPGVVYRLCERKWNELELAKRAVEIRIAGHYPASLCQQAVNRPQRSNYANDIFMWMALAYFRQYLSQSGNDGRNRLAEDGGYAWYKMFATGGDAYLNHDDMVSFNQYFPMSPKACTVMEDRMLVLKEEVKKFVKDLMINRTHIDPEEVDGVEKPWLTCAVIETEDLPWNKGSVEEDETNEYGW